MQTLDLYSIGKTGDGDEISIPEHLADKLRMQGCMWSFCTLLRNTDDPEIIYFMFRQIMESGYHNDVREGKNFFPAFMREHATNNNVDCKLQFQKIIWVLKEYDDDDWALFCKD
jgi:hypothetical protein